MTCNNKTFIGLYKLANELSMLQENVTFMNITSSEPLPLHVDFICKQLYINWSAKKIRGR